MFTQIDDHSDSHRRRGWLRPFIEMIARVAMGEPASIVPTRQLDRLAQLERREQLKLAERQGDEQLLAAELVRAQLTPDELNSTSGGVTPIATWPADDVSGHFDDGGTSGPAKPETRA